MITIEKYKLNYWAVYENGVLVCVTVYKKGAREVVRRLSVTGTDNLPEPKINNDKFTKLSKELKAVNHKFSQLITEIKATENTPNKAILYNQNDNEKGEDHLCQQK